MEALDELWTCITNRIDEIKALPEDFLVAINDGTTDYGRINKADIKHDDQHAWLQLNRNTKLTFFTKEDYKPALNKARNGVSYYAQSEIAHVFDFSKAAHPETVFEKWEDYD